MSAGTSSIFIAALAAIALLAFGLISKGEDALAVGEELPETELPVLGGSDTGSITGVVKFFGEGHRRADRLAQVFAEVDGSGCIRHVKRRFRD